MKYCYLLPVLFLLASCTREAGVKYHFDLVKGMEAPREVRLSEICDSIRYVKLETTPESLLQGNEHIRVSADAIFAVGEHYVVKFDAAGQFVKRLAAQGRGPGEFLQISTRYLDEENRLLYLYDRQLKKIEVYDEMLEHARTISPVEPDVYSMVVRGEEIICGVERDDRRGWGKDAVRVLDLATGREKYAIPSHIPPVESSGFMIFSCGTALSEYKGNIYFCEHRSNEVYLLDGANRSDSLRFRVNIGPIYPAEIDYVNERRDEVDNYNTFVIPVETEKYIFLSFSYQGIHGKWAVHDKEGQGLTVINACVNDIDGGPNPMWFYRVRENVMLMTVPAMNLVEEKFVRGLREDGIDDASRTALLSLIEATTENDNPVLMFWYPKRLAR
jgi:hypothetical protein